MDEKKYKKIINSWSMYDWANSAFATTIMAAVLPIYYSAIAEPALTPNQATAYWGYTNSIALLLVALLSPILGAVADFRGAKKRYLTYFASILFPAAALIISNLRCWPALQTYEGSPLSAACAEGCKAVISLPSGLQSFQA